MSRLNFLIPELRFMINAPYGLMLFFFNWVRSRSVLRIFTAVPAFVLASVFLWSMVISRSAERRSLLLNEYLESARHAVRDQNINASRLDYRRTQELSNNSEDVTFEYAEAMFSLGQTSDSLQLMAGLAPINKPGYIPAHRFLADHVQIEDPLKADKFRAIHLSHMVRDSTQNRLERLELVRIFARYKEFDLVDRLLQQSLDEYPEDRFMRATIKARMGKIEDARAEASLACDVLKPFVAGDPANIDRRTQLAQGHVFLGEFLKAIEVLAEGLPYDADGQLLESIATTYTHWYSLLTPSQQQSQLRCLHRLVYRKLSDDERAGQTDLATTDLFRSAMETEQRDVILLALLGTANAASGDLISAERSLRAALTIAPNEPTVSNNLAWVLSRRATEIQNQAQDNNDSGSPLLDVSDEQLLLSEAKVLVDSAVRLMPDVADFRETRGQVLYQLGLHNESIDDLRHCLESGLSTKSIHQTLADSFNILGQPDDAHRHSEFARRMN